MSTPPSIAGNWSYFVQVLRYDTPGVKPTFSGNTYTQSFNISIEQNNEFVIVTVPKQEPLRPNEGYYVGYWNKVYIGSGFIWELSLSDYDDNGVYDLTVSQVDSQGQIIKLSGNYTESGFGENPPGVQKPTAGFTSLTKIVPPVNGSNNMQRGFPSLTPTYGLGSYGRTGMAILISSPRSRNGSQGRIYSWFKQQGKGQQYIEFLINSSGVKYLPRVNPWTSI